MKAFSFAGRRNASGIRQVDLAKQIGWPIDALRAVELGQIDVTEEQINVLENDLDTAISNREAEEKKAAKASA